MEIRPIRQTDDRLAISRIYEESWKFAYREIIPQAYLSGIPAGNWAKAVDRDDMHTLLLLEDDCPIGTSSYCAARFPEFTGFGEIVSIYLLPQYMGKGYGRPLLDAAIAGLTQMGFSQVFLWVLEENVRARKFYEKAGFTCSGRALADEIGGKALREIAYVRAAT